MRSSAREHICTGLGVAVLVAALALPAPAQDAQSLVKEAKNPLANLINVQFFYDALLNVGPDKNVQDTLTIQPVIPFALDANWSVITRTVLPVISQPAPAPGGSATNGVGDTSLRRFYRPPEQESGCGESGLFFRSQAPPMRPWARASGA
jgi:hypothetical protein